MLLIIVALNNVLIHFHPIFRCPSSAQLRMPREKVHPTVPIKEKVFVATKTRRGLEKLVLRTPSPTPAPISRPRKAPSQSPSKRQRLGDYDMQDGGGSPQPEIWRKTKVL